MKAGWQSKPFEECIEKVTYTQKIQRKDFLGDGTYPIVSQEEDFINGYWDNEVDLFSVATPVVVFGDHTKVLKFVDFDFVLGADGVKILQPCEFLEPRFFFYQLQTANLDSLGYARHYKLLKELEIGYPARSEQQRIVGILDAAFDGIAIAKACKTPAPCSKATCNPSSPSAARGGNKRRWKRSQQFLGEANQNIVHEMSQSFTVGNIHSFRLATFGTQSISLLSIRKHTVKPD
jgi:restriction endonuclease S subunit